MTSIRPIAGLVVAALLGACGPGLQAQEPALGDTETVATTVETSAASSQADPATPSEATQPGMGEVDRSQVSSTTTSTADQAVTTRTQASPVGGEQPTTTAPTSDEAFDIQSVLDALDALDAMLGDFDSEVGAIDLDEEEGDTP